MSFSTQEAFGQLQTHELKPGGTDIPVTEDNKDEYVDLMVKWRLDRGVAKQMEAFKKGFGEVLPVHLLTNFDPQELEFLTAGTLEIDVDDWKAHTEYRNGQWVWFNMKVGLNKISCVGEVGEKLYQENFSLVPFEVSLPFDLHQYCYHIPTLPPPPPPPPLPQVTTPSTRWCCGSGRRWSHLTTKRDCVCCSL